MAARHLQHVQLDQEGVGTRVRLAAGGAQGCHDGLTGLRQDAAGLGLVPAGQVDCVGTLELALQGQGAILGAWM